MEINELRRLVLDAFNSVAWEASQKLSSLAEQNLLDSKEAEDEEKRLETAVRMYVKFKARFKGGKSNAV